jgi:hypothetical protein
VDALPGRNADAEPDQDQLSLTGLAVDIEIVSQALPPRRVQDVGGMSIVVGLRRHQGVLDPESGLHAIAAGRRQRVLLHLPVVGHRLPITCSAPVVVSNRSRAEQ